MEVTIIGAGAVGRTLAYSLLLGGGIRELVLVGRRRAPVKAEVLDLRHAATFSHPRLNSHEQEAFHRCADVVRSTIASF